MAAQTKPNGRRTTASGADNGSGAGATAGATTILDATAGAGKTAGAGAGAGAGITLDNFWQTPSATGAGAGAGEPDATGAGAGAGAGAETRRGPGRPKGSGAANAVKKEKVSASLDGIEGILLSIHLMGATILKVPELALSDDEAKKITAAIARVASHYDVGASEKSIAWANLAICAGGVYGTRIWTYQLRTKAEQEIKRQQQQQEQQASTIPFPVANPR